MAEKLININFISKFHNSWFTDLW